MDGKTLRRCRNKLGITQHRLAELLEFTDNMISEMERGKHRVTRRTELAVRCIMYEARVIALDPEEDEKPERYATPALLRKQAS